MPSFFVRDIHFTDASSTILVELGPLVLVLAAAWIAVRYRVGICSPTSRCLRYVFTTLSMTARVPCCSGQVVGSRVQVTPGGLVSVTYVSASATRATMRARGGRRK